MCSGAFFLVGLFVFFKGSFRFASRTIEKEQARQMAVLLMVPFIFGICAGTFVGFTSAPVTNMDELAESMSGLLVIELLMLAGVVGFVLYWIYSRPKTLDGEGMTFVKSKMMDVMTPAEAADYLRVSENDVRALIDDGKLPAARIGGDFRIARRAIDDYLTSERYQNPFDDL